MARHRTNRQRKPARTRAGDPRTRAGIPESPTLPGSLAQELHDIGSGRRSFPPESAAIRHHYIAQMLLREWVDDGLPGERLWQLDKASGAVVPQTTEAAASVRRLYRARNEDTGEQNNHLESFFAMVENHAAVSLRRLGDDLLALDEGDRANVSLLLALQDLRTPAGQERMLAQLSAAARAWFATTLSDQKRTNRRYMKTNPGATWQDAERWRRTTLEELRDGTLAIDAVREHVLRGMMQSWLGFAGAIHDMNWKLLRAREGHFVIGDRPMVMHDPTPRFPFSGNGLRSSATAYTLMPLSPHTMLRLDQQGGRLEERTARRSVATANLRSYGWANRFVYGSRAQTLEELHAYAVDHPDEVPRPRPDPQVICEKADPNDPAVGRDHPPGYPRGFWYTPPDAEPQYMAYRLQYPDDPRTVAIDESFV
jgi:hypothetical protein